MTAEPTNRDNARPDGNHDRIEPAISADGAETQADREMESDIQREIENDSGLSSHDERLFALASRIDQGHAIDWDAAERDAADDRERAVIAEMRLLADVARVGREHATPADPLAAALAGAGLDAAQAASAASSVDRSDNAFDYELPPPPARWGSLTIHEPIGRGAFATVYRAQDNLGRLVALKLFPLPDELAIDWAARLLHEGRLLARLHHENVVTIHGADQGDGYVGLWMEFVKGRTLEDELHTRVRFSADEAVQVGRVLCRALAAVHREGLLHRDVKAHNVMRDETGRIVLMDFGSGRELGLEDARAGGELVGTPLYLAPEVFAGQPASIASDIYSLGVLLFHLVSDRYPVQGSSRAEIQDAHLERRRLYLRDERPDLPDPFVRVVERAIAADRTQRFQSAGEFEDALAGTGMLASPVSSGGSSAPVIPSPTAARDLPGQLPQPPGQSQSQPQPSSPPQPDTKAQAHAHADVHAGRPSDERLRPRYRWQTITAGASLLLAAVILLVVLPRVMQSPSPSPGSSPLQSQSGTPTGSSNGGSAVPTPPASATPASTTPTSAPASSDARSYAVQAAFFTQDRKDGHETTLASGDRVTPGSLLGLRVQTSKPAYVYVANQDEDDHAFVLYPLRDAVQLAPNREHRLPEDDTGDLWQVSSPGGREHFVVFVSLTPLKDFDQILRSVPRAAAGRAVSQVQIPKDLIWQTRGVGGLARAHRTPSSGLGRLFDRAQPLSEQRETVEGEWVRTLMLVNPVTRRHSSAGPSTSPASPVSPSVSTPSR